VQGAAADASAPSLADPSASASTWAAEMGRWGTAYWGTRTGDKPRDKASDKAGSG
jgi:hypothetical protein